jgi:transcriptional regulator with XRE-family HTH domain
MRVSSIGEYIKEQREQAKISLRQLAAAAGVSNPYLSQIERGLRRPSAEILQQIAKGLRISAEALYVQAGILEDRPPDSGVRAAVLAEPDLTERQKQVLLEIYDSFRKEAVALAELAPGAQSAAGEEARMQEMPAASAGAGAAQAPGPDSGVEQAPGLRKEEEDDDDPLAAGGPLGVIDETFGERASAPGSTGRPGQADQER